MSPSASNKHNPPYNCETCQKYTEEYIRKSWHCGYLDEGDWLPLSGKEMPPIRGKLPTEKIETAEDADRYFEVDVCPGWIVRQPGITQATEAMVAMECGELSTFYPRKPAAILEAAILLKSSFGAHQSEEIEKLRAKDNGKHR